MFLPCPSCTPSPGPLPSTLPLPLPTPLFKSLYFMPPSPFHCAPHPPAPSPSPSASFFPHIHKHSQVSPIFKRRSTPVLFLLQATTSSFSLISSTNFWGENYFMCPFQPVLPTNDVVIRQTQISVLNLPLGYSLTLIKSHVSQLPHL